MPRKPIGFDLDFVFKDIFPRFTVKQFDDVTFNIKPKLQGSDYDTTGMTGKIFVGVNNDMFMQTEGITVTSNNINIVLDKNMLQKNGRAYAEIELTDSSGTITSSSFIFNIDTKIGEGGQIPGGFEGFVQKYERLISEFRSQVNSSIDNCNENVDNKLNSVDTLVNTKISDFENRFNALTTSKQQDAEVIDARGGENSLKARLDKINSQLAHIENKITSINISSFKLDTNTWADAYYLALESLNGNDGEIVFSESCEIDRTLIVRKGLVISGGASRGNTIKFVGSGNLFELKESQWDKSLTFKNLYISGNGTSNNYGTNATNNGIYIGDELTSDLINIPFVIIENCKITNFNIGVYLEGYNHNLSKNQIYRNNKGVCMVHPEQTMMLNNFIEYCDIGVEINPLNKIKAGHMCIIEGGAVQRCNKGLVARNFYQLRYRTYSELNKLGDIILGEEDDTNYKYSVHGAKIDLFSSSKLLENASIQIYGSQDIEIHFSSDLTYPTSHSHIVANGYSKYITVYQGKEKISSVNEKPYDFRGNSIKTSIVYKGANKKYMDKESILTEFGEFAKFIGDYKGYRNTLAYHLNNANFDIVSNNGSSGFRLINNIDDAYELMAYFYPNGNFNINKGNVSLDNGDFVTKKNGGGFWTKSPNGTTYKVYVGDDGVVKAQQQ